MSALAAFAALAFAAAPGSIELALAERTGPNTARLTLLRADERLQALCLDLDGWSDEMIDQAQKQVTTRTVWLYAGSRKVARGRVGRFESSGSPTAPCAVTAEARFEGYVPLTAGSEVLWATTRDLGSQPQRPLPRQVAERALTALPSGSCPAPSAQSARAVAQGTFVGLVCAGQAALVFVPARGAPARIPAVEGEGPAALLEAVDLPQARSSTLFLSREVEGGRRLEVWESDGREARRVDAWVF